MTLEAARPGGKSEGSSSQHTPPLPQGSRLVVASNDGAVIRDFRRALNSCGIDTLTLLDVQLPEPTPRGRNAIEIVAGKAAAVAALARTPAVALVEEFRINPMVHFGVSDPEWRLPHPWPRSEKLLMAELDRIDQELTRGGYVGPDDRGAYFYYAICFGWPDGETRIFESTTIGQVVAPMVAGTPPSFAGIFVPDGARDTLASMKRPLRDSFCPRRRALGELKRLIA